MIFKFKLRVFGEIWGFCEVGRVFFMSAEFGIMANFGLEVDLWWFGDFENIFVSVTHVFERNYLISLR